MMFDHPPTAIDDFRFAIDTSRYLLIHLIRHSISSSRLKDIHDFMNVPVPSFQHL